MMIIFKILCVLEALGLVWPFGLPWTVTARNQMLISARSGEEDRTLARLPLWHACGTEVANSNRGLSFVEVSRKEETF